MKSRPAVLTSLTALALAISVAGCETPSRYQQVKDDATPNLDTLYQRPTDVDNAMVVTCDENGRMFWEDMGRLWLLDRPSRLAREPIPPH